uniref:Uncharacterized protein n=1 Tax=Solanum lycopersicum TaxID=4081 RepID=A0A3Q7J0L6_SOLLC
MISSIKKSSFFSTFFECSSTAYSLSISANLAVQCISKSSAYSSNSPLRNIFFRDSLVELKIRMNIVNASATELKCCGNLLREATLTASLSLIFFTISGKHLQMMFA